MPASSVSLSICMAVSLRTIAVARNSLCLTSTATAAASPFTLSSPLAAVSFTPAATAAASRIRPLLSSLVASNKLSSNPRHSGLVSCEAFSSAAGLPTTAEPSEMDGIVPAVIVGGGRLGLAFEKMGLGSDVVVRRGEAIPADRDGPIIVCTRNDDLDAVVDATSPSRRNDLVFVQNGMLEPWMQTRGISEATQVLVYFAVAKLGESPVDGKTDLNPEGLTAASGKWASAIAKRLHLAGLSCKVLDFNEFKKPLLEKLIWISAFMLVGARHPRSSIGEVEKNYRDEVDAVVLKSYRLHIYSNILVHEMGNIKILKWHSIAKEAQR